MTVTDDALDLLAGDPPRYPHIPGDFHRHPETGAPYVNHPTETRKDGTPKRVMYGRPSSFGAALDNPFNLVKWKERQLLIGASILQHSWLTEVFEVHPDDRDALDGLAARCHDAAGSHLAADQGTHIHKLLEWYDKDEYPDDDLIAKGEALGIPADLQHHIISQWWRFRDRIGVRALAVEQTVVNDRWRLAGTLDRLDVADRDILTAYGVLEAGVPFVGDIKTGGLTLGNDGQPNYWVKYPVQLAAYVDAVPYNTETDERSPIVGPDVDRPHAGIALIYHYDLARALAGEIVDWQIIPVNVQAGREGGDLCRQAADFAKRRDLFAMPAPTNGEPCSDTTSNESSESPTPATTTTGSFSTTPAPMISAPVNTLSSPPRGHLGSTASPDQFAASGPVAPVEQPAAEPSLEPGSAANLNVRTVAAHIPMTAEVWREMGGTVAPINQDRLRQRVKDLVAAGHEQVMRQHWPEGVPTLKHDGHSDAQLQLILAAVRRVEAEVGAPFVPGDVTSRSGAINRARKAWKDSGRDEAELWFAATVLATYEQCRNPDCTLDNLIAQFTIEQADRLTEQATQHTAH